MYCDCVCICGKIKSIIVWWVNFSVWFRMCEWSFISYLVVGKIKDYNGDCDLWNGFCEICCWLDYFYGRWVYCWVRVGKISDWFFIVRIN